MCIRDRITTYLIYHDRLAISSAVAFTNLLWKSIGTKHLLEPEWWLEEYVKVVREIEGDNSSYKPRFGDIRYIGPAWYFIDKAITRAINERWSLYTLSNIVGSGAYLLETIPMVLYTLILYADNPFKALTKSVTVSKDSDTIGAIVGYFLGALHGIKGFPKHLLDPVIEDKLLPSTFLELIHKTEEYLLKQKNRTFGKSNIVIDVTDTLIYSESKVL